MAAIEDFRKLDIRIGKILSAEKVAGADKLIKLEVDLGEEKRQIVAAMAEFFEANDLVGCHVPVIINLEPKTFKSIESQGMIMAADIDGRPILLHPAEEVPPGTIVR